MDQPELANDDRFATHAARGHNMTELDSMIGAWTSALTADEALDTLESNGVPAGRIYTAREMLGDPHYLARGMVQRVVASQGWELPVTGVVPRFVRTPGRIRHTGPELGADTRDVLADVAGLSADEIDELLAAGLI